ncbi:hypothetical protein MPN29_04100 [Riemerella anatipestifer]|uniref:hypothetical protein n=1 Tax=Riemerella anatipestifer TaxID=34085 RepID=UPI001C9A2022|nr:hypothetical protein [Riemerella anatipestifer]MDD1548729.1 hypothetical protein [Riemerella anatipestifer]QZO84017.1 hypothetical protein K6T40_04185 [Riemerella anatipestifer]WKV54887.1 hypothetical protein MPN29_04100 [Riemerella anatipestifer]WKV57020.1 hypothetical protein MWN58_04100 [Riemerella anatipestifer]WKV59152.1 hypothetical protein MWN59_04100 [Riemerella anatipestifer]
MKTILQLILSLIFLASCSSVNKNKQLQEITKVKTQNDSIFNSTNSKLSEVLNENKSLKAENISFKNEIENYKVKLKELQEKSLSESSEDLVIENAKGIVKLTDRNGNSYEIGADNGTKILRTTTAKLQNELSEKISEINSLKTLTEKQKQTIEQLEKKHKNISKHFATFRKEIKSVEESLNKLETTYRKDKKTIPLWLYGLIGVSIILIWEFSKYAIKSRLKIF